MIEPLLAVCLPEQLADRTVFFSDELQRPLALGEGPAAEGHPPESESLSGGFQKFPFIFCVSKDLLSLS